MRTLLLPLLLVANAVACTRAPESQSATLDAAPANANTSAAFLEGLAAAPGSAARRRAGDILAASLAPHLAAMSRVTGPGAADAKQVASVLRLSAEYMQAATTCAPSERVTLYRGFGRQPIFRPNAQSGGFMVNNVWLANDDGTGLINDIRARRDEGRVAFTDREAHFDTAANRPVVTGDDIGQVIFNNRAALQSFKIDAQPWKELTENYKWSDLASEHTVGERSTILISATTSDEVADNFGPGFLTLSVCPERAFLVDYVGEDFGELEVYVPLFILPEEIVRVDQETCGQIEDEEQRDQCFTGTFSDPRPNLTPTTSIYRSCLANFNTKGELSQPWLLHDRYEQKVKPAYARLVRDSADAAALRSGLSTLGANQCKADCELAGQILTRLETRLEQDGPDAEDATEQRANIEGLERAMTGGGCRAR